MIEEITDYNALERWAANTSWPRHFMQVHVWGPQK